MSSAAQDRFWELAEEFLVQSDIEKGTLMGHACLRVGGEFLATIERKTGNLVIKLNKERLAELVASREGLPFAPAGRVFSEWVAIPRENLEVWRERIEEGVGLARVRV